MRLPRAARLNAVMADKSALRLVRFVPIADAPGDRANNCCQPSLVNEFVCAQNDVVRPALDRADTVREIDSNAGGNHCARFQTNSIWPPLTEVGLWYFISLALIEVIMRFCSIPSWLGNVVAPIFKFTVLSASLTVYVPK
jgi:hypothetical protein